MSALDPKRTCPLQGRKFSRYHRLVWLGAPVGGRAVRDGAVPFRGSRRRVALDLGGGAGAAGGADRQVVGGVVGGAGRESCAGGAKNVVHRSPLLWSLRSKADMALCTHMSAYDPKRTLLFTSGKAFRQYAP